MQTLFAPEQISRQHTILSSTYRSQWLFLDSTLLCCLRWHHWAQSTTLTEVFGNQALLFVGSPEIDKFSVEINGEALPHLQYSALYFPPFSIAKWKIKPCHIEWAAFVYRGDMRQLPQCPLAIEWGPKDNLRSSSEFIQKVCTQRQLFRFERSQWNSHVPFRVKKFIDAHYRENISLREISRRLNIGCTTMDIQFRNFFGVTPSWYRNQLRVYESVNYIMLENKEATHAAFEVGFKDFSTFFRNMRKILGVTPSQYKRSNS